MGAPHAGARGPAANGPAAVRGAAVRHGQHRGVHLRHRAFRVHLPAASVPAAGPADVGIARRHADAAGGHRAGDHHSPGRAHGRPPAHAPARGHRTGAAGTVLRPDGVRRPAHGAVAAGGLRGAGPHRPGLHTAVPQPGRDAAAAQAAHRAGLERHQLRAHARRRGRGEPVRHRARMAHRRARRFAAECGQQPGTHRRLRGNLPAAHRAVPAGPGGRLAGCARRAKADRPPGSARPASRGPAPGSRSYDISLPLHRPCAACSE